MSAPEKPARQLLPVDDDLAYSRCDYAARSDTSTTAMFVVLLQLVELATESLRDGVPGVRLDEVPGAHAGAASSQDPLREEGSILDELQPRDAAEPLRQCAKWRADDRKVAGERLEDGERQGYGRGGRNSRKDVAVGETVQLFHVGHVPIDDDHAMTFQLPAKPLRLRASP